ncbi:hypothetical protein ES705_49322 [subsurface metagenome]
MWCDTLPAYRQAEIEQMFRNFANSYLINFEDFKEMPIQEQMDTWVMLVDLISKQSAAERQRISRLKKKLNEKRQTANRTGPN